MIKVTFATAIFFLFSAIIALNICAVPIQFTFTADNVVGQWYKNGGNYTVLSLSGSNLSNWRYADTLTLDLDVGHCWEVVWQVINTDLDGGYREPGAGNPGGFLGQYSTGGYSVGSCSYDPLSNATWDVAQITINFTNGTFEERIAKLSQVVDNSVLTGLQWTKATEWAFNKGNYVSGNPKGYSGTSIWTQVAPSSVQGISNQAKWIWTKENFDMTGAPGLHYTNGQLTSAEINFIRVKVQPIPEPGTLILLGSGLVGLVGYGKIYLSRRKKS